MVTSYYARPDEDLAQEAIAVTGSAEDPVYPATNLILPDPANPAKLTTNSGNFVLEFSGAITPVAAALIYEYLDAGLEVRLQGHTSNSWGAPTFNQTFTIPAKRRDGPSYQRWTVSPWMLVDTSALAFWRVVVVGTNSQVVVIGRVLLLSALHEVTLFHDGPIEQSERPNDDPGQIVQPTELGVRTVLTLTGPKRGLTGVFIGTDLQAGNPPHQDAADFRALIESAEGQEKLWPFIPFGDVNDLWLVHNTSGAGIRSHRQGGYQIWPFDVREADRGLPFP